MSDLKNFVIEEMAKGIIEQLTAENAELHMALRHITHNAKASGCELGLAIDVAEDALSKSSPQVEALLELVASSIQVEAINSEFDSDSDSWTPDDCEEVNRRMKRFDAAVHKLQTCKAIAATK